MLPVKQRCIKYSFFFLVFGKTQPGIVLQSARPLANTLKIMPMDQLPMYTY